jgi:fatty acid desaturase
MAAPARARALAPRPRDRSSVRGERDDRGACSRARRARHTFVLYAAAFLVAIVVSRFFDAFHHTFELVTLASYDEPYGPPAGRTEMDRAYEDENTFSNVVSTRWPALNVLALNFPYHNAHHAKPGLPWHRLPELDRRLHGEGSLRRLPAGRMLVAFHRHRIARVLGSPAVDPRLLGAVGVSLLTL